MLIFVDVFFLSSAPNTNYSFIVAGVTSNGIGPFSDPVDFSTPEGGLSWLVIINYCNFV